MIHPVTGRVHPDYRPPYSRLRVGKPIKLQDCDHEDAIRRAEAYHVLCVKRAREDFGAFMELCFTDPVTRLPFQMQWFHDEWDAAIRAHNRLLIIAPRSHGKTSQIVGQVLYMLGRNPNLRIKIVCASDPRAMERLFEIRQHLEGNRAVHEVFPGLQPDAAAEWSKHRLIVKRDMRMKDASVEAVGVTSSVTGGRADMIIADDIVDRRNGFSKAARDDVKRAWFSDWTNLIEPTGRVIAICTLWHKEDLNYALMECGEYEVKKYQVDDQFAAIWPDKWSEERLRKRYREIGSIEFNRAFRNLVTDADTKVIRDGWLQFANLQVDPDFQRAAQANELFTITSYDTATSVGDDADYSAGVALAVHPPSRRCYVLDAWHARQTVAQQAAQIYREYQHYRPYRILIEKAGQAVVDEWLISEYPEVRPIVETVRPVVGKVQRLQAVTPLFERGEVILSSHLDPEAAGWTPGRENVIQELWDFPVGKNDDQVDALVYALAAARRYFLDAWAPGVQTGELNVTIGAGGRGDDAYPF